MSYVLFLDDEREPPWWLGYQPEVCRDVAEMKGTIIVLGLPSIISFDHDLGKFPSGDMKPNGLQGMKWLIEQHLDGMYDLNTFEQVYVHSANPAGVENLVSLWDSFAASVLQSEVKAKRRQADG